MNVDIYPTQKHHVPSLKLTFSHLKMDGWNTSFLLGWPIFRGYVSFRECTASHSEIWGTIFGHIFIFRLKNAWRSPWQKHVAKEAKVDYFKLPSSKLTWQWKISNWNRKYVFNPGPFSSQPCELTRVYLDVHLSTWFLVSIDLKKDSHLSVKNIFFPPF